MAVISVEVPDSIAKKIKYNIISIKQLYDYDDEYHDDIVDFGKNGVGKEEFLEYLSNK